MTRYEREESCRRTAIAAVVAFALGVAFVTTACADLVGRTVVITPSPAGNFDLRCPDGDCDEDVPPTAPALGQPVATSHATADVPLAAPCTGGTSPLTYELRASTTNASTGFSVIDAAADFGEDGVLSLSGLTAETEYWLLLACVDDEGLRSGFSEVQSFTTPVDPVSVDVTPPTEPPSISCGSTATGQGSVTWGASTDAVGVTVYSVVRGTGNGSGGPLSPPNGTEIATIVGSPPATSFSEFGLTPGQEYYYLTRAGDAAGNFSTFTDRCFFTAATTPDPPSGNSDTPDYPDPVAADFALPNSPIFTTVRFSAGATLSARWRSRMRTSRI